MYSYCVESRTRFHSAPAVPRWCGASIGLQLIVSWSADGRLGRCWPFIAPAWVRSASGWGLAFTQDCAAQPCRFPFGRYAFLQMVGITPPELQEIKAASTAIVLARLAEHDPDLRTDPTR